MLSATNPSGPEGSRVSNAPSPLKSSRASPPEKEISLRADSNRPSKELDAISAASSNPSLTLPYIRLTGLFFSSVVSPASSVILCGPRSPDNSSNLTSHGAGPSRACRIGFSGRLVNRNRPFTFLNGSARSACLKDALRNSMAPSISSCSGRLSGPRKCMWTWPLPCRF